MDKFKLMSLGLYRRLTYDLIREEPENNLIRKGGLVGNQHDDRDATRPSSNGGISAFAYLITGLGIGAALSIFLAPQSGAETRQWIANKCLDGLDTANESVRDTRQHVKDVMDQGQEKISEAVEAAREAVAKA